MPDEGDNLTEEEWLPGDPPPPGVFRVVSYGGHTLDIVAVGKTWDVRPYRKDNPLQVFSTFGEAWDFAGDWLRAHAEGGHA